MDIHFTLIVRKKLSWIFKHNFTLIVKIKDCKKSVCFWLCCMGYKAWTVL